jgi:3',5'-nucleoside bisphosphate phosphatase
MSPKKIVAKAVARNIGMLAICDHNTAENAPAVVRAAAGGPPAVLPGMEICSREEIHVLGIFDRVDAALELQSIVHDHLPGKNDPEVFGPQVIANEFDEVVGFEERLLIGACDLPVDRVVDEIHRLGGIAIASHIDRQMFSVIRLNFDALELTGYTTTADARHRFNPSGKFPFVRNSDAHQLEDLGSNTSEYLLEKPGLDELRKAFTAEDGRAVCEE